MSNAGENKLQVETHADAVREKPLSLGERSGPSRYIADDQAGECGVLAVTTLPIAPSSSGIRAQQNAANGRPIDDDEAWDDFVASNPQGHHEQCSWYGLTRMTHGFRCDRVVIRDGDDIIGGAQILSQSTPIGIFAVIQRGPYVRDDDEELMNEVVRQIDLFARKRSYVSLRVDTLPTQSVARTVLAYHGFAASEAWRAVPSSLAVQLSQTDEQLLAQMKQKGRYNIRIAQRHDVCIRVGDAESIDEFYSLYTQSAQTNGFLVFPRLYFHYLWRTFGSNGRAQHFVAYHNEKPLAAIFNTVVGDHMIYGWGGVHRGEEERKLMANYLLHFRAMCWARDHACTQYDLAGVTQFKRKIVSDQVNWPLAMRKFYGRFSSVRRMLLDCTWSRPALRRGVSIAARRLGIHPTMPW